MATDIGLDRVTGVSINALTGYLVAVPFAFAIVAMIWWARHSDVTHERVWHVGCPAVVSGLSLVGAAYLGNPILAAVALTIGVMGAYAEKAGVKPRSPKGRAQARGLDAHLRLQHPFMRPVGRGSAW